MNTQQRFDAFTATVMEATSVPFEYGKNDCLLFVARAVRRLTGIDHAAQFLPYDMRRALLLLNRAGGIIPFVSQFLGEPAERFEPRICDPCVVEAGDEQIAGLWSSKHVVLIGTDFHCVRVVAPDHVVASWRL